MTCDMKDFSFAMTVHCDHERKATFITLWEYGSIVRSRRYIEQADYRLLVGAIEAFKGVGCCDAVPDKPDPNQDLAAHKRWLKMEMANPKYWNRPLHDPYATEAQRREYEAKHGKVTV